ERDSSSSTARFGIAPSPDLFIYRQPRNEFAYMIPKKLISDIASDPSNLLSAIYEHKGRRETFLGNTIEIGRPRPRDVDPAQWCALAFDGFRPCWCDLGIKAGAPHTAGPLKH